MKTLKSFRLDNELIAKLEVIADKELRSLNNQVEYFLTTAVDCINMVNPKPVALSKIAVKQFVPPTVDDVKEYIAARGYSFDAEAFVAHYEANGWMRGKNKIKNWKACCTTWSKSPQRADSTTKKATLRDDLTDTSWAG